MSIVRAVDALARGIIGFEINLLLLECTHGCHNSFSHEAREFSKLPFVTYAQTRASEKRGKRKIRITMDIYTEVMRFYIPSW